MSLDSLPVSARSIHVAECKRKALSLQGTKIEYIPPKHATTTTSLLVLDYDPIDAVNMVKELGKTISRRDVVRLLKEFPSAVISKCSHEDPIFIEYSEETASANVRKSAVEASKKIKRDADDKDEIEDVGPPPRRPRGMPRAQQGSQNGTPCCVCWSEGDTYVALQPCWHTNFCLDCATSIQRGSGVCPICRAGITGTQRIYPA